MVPLLAINHQFQLRELLGDRKYFFLVYLFVARKQRSTWLLFVVERVLTETARVASS